MIVAKIQEIKQSHTNSQYNLAISMFEEDIKFHNNFNIKTELCEVLEQAANIARRF